MANQLPSGFQLDQPQGLPSGFQLDRDPKIELQNLLIRQSKGEQGLESQIAQLRQQTGVSGQRGLAEGLTPAGFEQEKALQEISQTIDPSETLAVGIGRGLTDIGRATGLAEPAQPSERLAFESLEANFPTSQAIARATGQALPFLPAGVAVGGIPLLTGRIAAGAAVGGLEGAAIESGTGGQDTGQAAGIGGAIAGAAEALFPFLSRIGGALVRRLTGKTPSNVFDAQGNPTKALEDALDESGLTLDDLNLQAQEQLLKQPPGVDPAQAARAAQFEQLDITPTRAQITREAADFQAQQEAAKTSNRVRGALEGQEGLLVNRFDEAVTGTGGQAVTSGSPVIDKVVNLSTALDNEISTLYGLAREVAPGAKNVKLNRLGDTLRKNAPSNTITGGLIKAIKGELQQRGIINKNFKVVGKIDVETAEEVRKVMNSFFNSTTDFGRQKLREFKNALDDDVFSVAGEDVFKEARAAKASFEKKLNRAKISKFDSRKPNLVRDVLENKINPDTFVNDVVTSKKWRAADLQQLKQFTTEGGVDNAPWDDLRAETLDFIKNQSFIGPEDAAGNKALSRAALQRTMQKIGPEKLKVLFQPEELKFLRDVFNVSKLREPVRGTALGKGPSAQAVKSLEDRVRNLPLVGSIIDVIDFDAQGRAVIRSNPVKTIRQRSNLEKIIPGAISVPLIAAENQ
ncbi:hypothetical protein KAR91_46350 [Candidatus Pacearchaeota archaeon]|nr:hypothetical protein [Candidatus Pacearchaeota archaeon]